MSGLIVGLGRRRYSVYRPKNIQPDETLFNSISDATIVSDALIILCRKDPELLLFSLDGQFQRSVHLPQLTYGHGIRAFGGEEFSVTDMDGHKILILDHDFNEKLILDCGNRPGFQAPFNHPTDCARSQDGRYYVADGYGNSVVHIFSLKGELIRTFGGPGNQPGQFTTPHAVLIDHQDRVCIADRENHRIQRFSLDGDYIDEIKDLYKPMALEMLPGGTLLCTDQTPRMSAYSPHGELVGRCRTFGTFGHGLAVTPDGSIVVVEMMPNQISILRPVEA